MKRNDNLQFLLKKTKKFLIIETATKSLKTFLLGLSILLFSVFIFAFIEVLAYFNPNLKSILFFVLAGLFLILFFVSAIPLGIALLQDITKQYIKPSEKLGEIYGLKDQLKNILSVFVSKSDIFYSQELSLAELNRIADIIRSKKINFFKETLLKNLAKTFYIFSLFVLITVISVFASDEISNAYYRLYNYDKRFDKLKKYQIEIFPGDVEILKGKDLAISGRIYGAKPQNVYLNFKSMDKIDYQKIKINLSDSLKFQYEIKNINYSIFYYLEIDDESTREYKAILIYPPSITRLIIRSEPPMYSKLPKQEFIDNGNFSALIGARIFFEIEANNLLRKAEIISENQSIALNLKDKKAVGSFVLSKDFEYYFKLTDIKGNENETKVDYKISAIVDYPPLVEILSPGKDQILGGDDRLPMLIKIADDFGFSKLILNYRIAFSKYEAPQKNFSSTNISFPSNLIEAIIPYIWNLSPLALGENDIVEYYLTVYDNDNINGPKSSKTSIYKLRVPSFDELYAEVETKQKAIEKELIKTYEEIQNLKKEIEEIEKKLKKDSKEISWEEKNKIESATKKFQELSKKAEELAKNLKETENQMRENNMLSQETLQKYLELQKLMEEFTSEELRKAFERLNEALANMDRRQIQEAMKNLSFNEEQFRASLERTINLFKRIQIEQKADEILKRIERIEKMQQEASGYANEKKLDEAAKIQNQITKELENLEKEMNKLNERMTEFEDMPSEEMKKFMEEFKRQQNDELSQEATKDLQSGNKQKANDKQNQISQNLKSAKETFQQSIQANLNKNQMQNFLALAKALNNIIELSKEQEKIKNESYNLHPSSQKFQELARKQVELSEALTKQMQSMAELSQKTFILTPEMGKALGKSKMNMQEAIKGFSDRNWSAAHSYGLKAMIYLNEAAKLIDDALGQMAQGSQGQGSGMFSFMRQLQSISQNQLSLNNAAQQLMQNGSLSPEAQAQLSRLAQQQEIIRKSLEELHKESRSAGYSKKLTQNLEDIAREMQEIATKMKSGILNDEILQKQERIFSRLLEAQRSINERDYEDDREAKTGKEFVRTSPGKLNLVGDETIGINEIYLQILKEGYNRDYEALIKKYFRSFENKKLKEK